MSLLLPGACAIAAAIAYGGSTAVQHSAAHEAGPATAGRADARKLVSLLVSPRWLLSVGGDAIGLVLQVIALATGPVVLVQPLLVLAVAVALPVGWALGGPCPGRVEVLAGVAVLAGLAVFFVLVGDPGVGRPIPPRTAAATAAVALVVGGALCVSVRRRSARVRAVVFGAVAGGGFGVVGVLLNGTADVFHADGFAGLLRWDDGLVPLIAVIVVGAASLVLTQVSFQIGELGASFPANEAAGPVVAVVLGGALLHERVPLSAPLLVAYVACLAVVVAGTIRLAGIRRSPSTVSRED